ncbi:hypothetical protein JTB14_017166 [Gonioctena quinquepunctata]|nr:hypothetical protein JTB14_017166 [Gonioctena quinquepunctata]
MFAGTASGVSLPVYVAYKSLTNMYPLGWKEGLLGLGIIDRSLYGLRYPFSRIALPYFKKLGVGTKCIIGDNLASHISVRVLELCIVNNIKFLLLLPKSSHLC